MPCLEWRKSSYSAIKNCVEVAFWNGWVLMRDSKNPEGRVLMFTSAEWNAFLEGIHKGQFALN